jgi:hypothetical protein
VDGDRRQTIKWKRASPPPEPSRSETQRLGLERFVCGFSEEIEITTVVRLHDMLQEERPVPSPILWPRQLLRLEPAAQVRGWDVDVDFSCLGIERDRIAILDRSQRAPSSIQAVVASGPLPACTRSLHPDRSGVPEYDGWASRTLRKMPAQ